MTQYAEPTWGSPEIRTRRSSVFDQLLIFPEDITALLVRVLQAHFMEADRIFNPGLKTRIWTPAKTTSKLYIGYSEGDGGKSASDNAAIYVAPAPVTNVPTHIPSSQINGALSTGGFFNGTRTGVLGSHDLICKGSSAAEAHSLASEVWAYLTLMAEAILRDARLNQFEVKQLVEREPSSQTQPGVSGTRTGVSVQWGRFCTYALPDEYVW
jgi:hypothetical protein